MRLSRVAFGIVLMLSQLAAQARDKPSAGPSKTSAGIPRTRVLTGATVTNARTA
jgi:hypothetical protein